MEKPTLLSGIQPSGDLMIGNYIGSIKNWVKMQDEYECLFPLVDLHSITVEQNPEELRKRSLDFIAMYIASGINPEKSTIFIQSHIPEHAQLQWILNCGTYLGELNRMTQFKDKSQKHSKNINIGLFNYPVLMAADILLYQTEMVPVGADQKQHLELARDIASRYNNKYNTELFKIPKPYIPPNTSGSRIMSLQNPENKMSKSDTNKNNLISLLDNRKTIINKFKKAVTDSDNKIVYDLKNKSGISNLIIIYAVISGKSIPEVEKHFAEKMYGHIKVELGELVADFLEPLQQRYYEIREDEKQLKTILKLGAEKARNKANKTLARVHEATGFVLP